MKKKIIPKNLQQPNQAPLGQVLREPKNSASNQTQQKKNRDPPKKWSREERKDAANSSKSLKMERRRKETARTFPLSTSRNFPQNRTRLPPSEPRPQTARQGEATTHGINTTAVSSTAPPPATPTAARGEDLQATASSAPIDLPVRFSVPAFAAVSFSSLASLLFWTCGCRAPVPVLAWKARHLLDEMPRLNRQRAWFFFGSDLSICL
jgi:hypothetical protein